MNPAPKLLGSTLLTLVGLQACATPPPPDISPNAVVPSAEQLAYQRMELIGFVHFTVNTFTNKEWGLGDESPDIFDPSELDTDQWARIAAEVGMKELILTAKHHDGFALWPSRYTDHSVKSSPWKDGQGDLVGAVRADVGEGPGALLYERAGREQELDVHLVVADLAAREVLVMQRDPA